MVKFEAFVMGQGEMMLEGELTGEDVEELTLIALCEGYGVTLEPLDEEDPRFVDIYPSMDHRQVRERLVRALSF
jgi:hypothetical protein